MDFMTVYGVLLGLTCLGGLYCFFAYKGVHRWNGLFLALVMGYITIRVFTDSPSSSDLPFLK